MTETLQMDNFTLDALRTLLEDSSDMIFFKDMNLVYRAASKSFAQMVGYESGEELIGKTDEMIFNSELTQKYTADDKTILETGFAVTSYTEPLPDEHGKKKFSSTSKYVIRNKDGQIIGICGVAKDITAQMELQDERERREQSRQLFEDVLEGDLTENKMLRTDNSRWAKNVGANNTTSFSDGVKLFAKHYIHEDYIDDYISHYDIDKLTEQYKNGVEEFSHMAYQDMGGHSCKWIEFTSKLYYSQVSKTLRIVTFLKDLDDEIKTKQILKRKAETDALTGLQNREHTIAEISACLESNPDKKHFLLFIDLDNFKEINDTKGHPFGDMVLQEISNNLKDVFREDDIIGRIGGDEFLVLLKDVPSREVVMERMKQIFKNIRICHCEGDYKYNVTCSIGVSECTPGKDFQKLYGEADQAMYSAKNSGKNAYTFFE